MSEVKKEIDLEIAHVLFVDIVGYSKLLINERSEVLHKIERSGVRDRTGGAAGDGMALVFRDSPEAPPSAHL